MTDRIYTQADLAYITSKSNEINIFSTALGVSATSVAAAIAKENSRYNQNKFLNDTQDWYATNSLTSHYAVTSASTAAIQAGWADRPVGVGNLIANASVIDMGISNIKVATAVKLLNDYYVKYPNDPLNLNEFKGKYQNIVTLLSESTGNDLTVKLSVLMIKEAQDFYTTPKVNAQGQALNISAVDWAAMRQEEKDGLMVMYFTRGEKSMTDARTANVAANGFFNPRLGDGESGGLWTVQNALPIGQAIGLAGYGQLPINGLTTEADTTPIFVAQPK